MTQEPTSTPVNQLLIGALVAPLAAPFVTLLTGILFDTSISFSVAPLVFVITLPLGYVLSLALGLPLALLLRRMGRLTVFLASGLTLVLATGLGLVISLNFASSVARVDAWKMALLFGIVSSSVAAVGCVVAGVPWRQSSAPPRT